MLTAKERQMVKETLNYSNSDSTTHWEIRTRKTMLRAKVKPRMTKTVTMKH
jgi:hypothetical protein